MKQIEVVADMPMRGCIGSLAFGVKYQIVRIEGDGTDGMLTFLMKKG